MHIHTPKAWLPCASVSILLLLLPHCTPRAFTRRTRICCHHYSTPPLPQYTPFPPPINIWVHGTLLGTTPIYRQPFLTQSRLVVAHELRSSSYLRLAANILAECDPQLFPLSSFYVFCWSGRLSAREREHSARVLLANLQQIRRDYKAQFRTEPHIRIFGHSHGGTVALAMARALHPEDDPPPIEELILLACPVQERSYASVKHAMFKRIISLYSALDFVQVCAPQLLLHQATSFLARINFPPTSKRLFPHQKNLVQTKIKINGRALTHSEFLAKRFLSKFPTIRRAMLTCLEEQRHPETTPPPTNLLCVYTRHMNIAGHTSEVTRAAIESASIPT